MRAGIQSLHSRNAIQQHIARLSKIASLWTTSLMHFTIASPRTERLNARRHWEGTRLSAETADFLIMKVRKGCRHWDGIRPREAFRLALMMSGSEDIRLQGERSMVHTVVIDSKDRMLEYIRVSEQVYFENIWIDTRRNDNFCYLYLGTIVNTSIVICS
jgi:hypothetical protein